MENLLNCHGRKFRAKINGYPTKGKITVENGFVYLCQDEYDGDDCEEKHGYKYSWTLRTGSPDNLITPNIAVTDLIVINPDPSTYKDWRVGDKLSFGMDEWEVIFRSGELVVCKDKSDCASMPYTCNELFNNNFRLVVDQPEPEIIELTLEEFAKLLGVPVESIRIKE